MARLKFELSEVIYCVPVPMRQFARLLRREEENIWAGKPEPALHQDLDGITGVRESNYDGHFGNAIYIRIDADFDNEALKEQLADVINEHLRRR